MIFQYYSYYAILNSRLFNILYYAIVVFFFHSSKGMASGNGPQQFRKAIGALKDSTKVGIAIVNSEYKVIQTIKLCVYISFYVEEE